MIGHLSPLPSSLERCTLEGLLGIVSPGGDFLSHSVMDKFSLREESILPFTGGSKRGPAVVMSLQNVEQENGLGK